MSSVVNGIFNKWLVAVSFFDAVRMELGNGNGIWLPECMFSKIFAIILVVYQQNVKKKYYITRQEIKHIFNYRYYEWV